MMPLEWKRILPGMLVGFGLLSACSGNDLGPCLAGANPAFILEIRDSVTDEGRAIPSTATVVDGSFSDTLPLQPFDGNTAWREGPMERGGTYDLTVAAPGYQTWTVENVTVMKGRCGIEDPARLQVHLQAE